MSSTTLKSVLQVHILMTALHVCVRLSSVYSIHLAHVTIATRSCMQATVHVNEIIYGTSVTVRNTRNTL